ncbi:hypothetical protein CN213_15915 [Sinorhizobium meliloti]|uniref:hypothetical protein n=1 Tax=Rhizobium meliloti TaxID=382 RepID=UPI000FDAE650|nr:hypothetical protein [Sinorhizobium meliloti]RVH56232.1 hypothetical protein CN213_15915 [Sinorhizobium meliloti]
MTAPAKNKPHKSASVPLFGWHTIYGAEGEHDTPYMTRAWFGRLRLHIFHRGDADPDCHDHPWNFWTFPLTPYVEEVAHLRRETIMEGEPAPPPRYFLAREVVPAFRLTYRPAEHCHRVIGRWTGERHRFGGVGGIFEGKPVPRADSRRIVTIVWRGGIGRRWGFLKNRDGRWCWIHWKEYVFNGGKNAPCNTPEGGDA